MTRLAAGAGLSTGRALAGAIEDLIPGAEHDTGQYRNNRVECDQGLRGR